MEKEIAILFADIRAFTQLSENKLPFDVVFMLNRYFAEMGLAVELAGGSVDKFIGDGVMAFWVVDGVPSDPCFASLTAAEHAVAGVGDVWIGNERLKVRIGLHLGEVSAGFFGTVTRRQYTIIGSEVNKAARLEQAKAEGLGFIRTSEEFFAALPEAIGSTHLPKRVTVDAKNIDGLVVHSSKGE
jgi:adenylate cyclase